MTPRLSARAGASAGFTLIELMVTVVIATILLSIAIPAYTSQMRKSRRTEAKTAALDFASREERYFSATNSYTTDLIALGYAPAGTTPAYPLSVGSNYYQITTPNVTAGAISTAGIPTPATFSVTLMPVAGNGQDKDTQCTSFTVTSTGQQSALNSSNTDSTDACWK